MKKQGVACIDDIITGLRMMSDDAKDAAALLHTIDQDRAAKAVMGISELGSQIAKSLAELPKDKTTLAASSVEAILDELHARNDSVVVLLRRECEENIDAFCGLHRGGAMSAIGMCYQYVHDMQNGAITSKEPVD